MVAHYLPWFGLILTGDEVHDILERTTSLKHTVQERVDFGVSRPYRVDRYEKD